jgi:hypothetical protein
MTDDLDTLASGEVILVEVADDRWNAYSLNISPTDHDKILFDLLVGMGGVNESVTPGRYYFGATELPDEKIRVSLTPITTE